MTDIIIIDKSASLCGYAYKTLTESYFVRLVDNNGIIEGGQGYMLDIIHKSDISVISCESCIIILGEDETAMNPEYENSSYIIANSLNDIQMSQLNRYTIPVIACGSRTMDCVSFTSINDSNVTVSLNRTVTALSGRQISPFEIPIAYCGESIYNILAVTALRILLDNFNSELGELY